MQRLELFEGILLIFRLWIFMRTLVHISVARNDMGFFKCKRLELLEGIWLIFRSGIFMRTLWPH